jgi:DNA-binding NarL/FixJ family response regulator
VVLMDISMPVLNGIEATRLIHAAYPTVRVIGLSIFEAAEQAQAMRDAGAVAYLTKAGPVETLIATIRECVAPRGRARPGDR